MFKKFEDSVLNFCKKHIKKVVSLILSLLIVGGTATVSYALVLDKSEYDALCKNYTYAGPADSSYNCLAYAVGYPTQWLWPWGESKPTDAQVTSFLSSMYGYRKVGSPYQPMVISHGTSLSSIAHFSKASGSNSYSKFGTYELFYHVGWDVFRGNYGTLKSMYLK